MSIQSTDIGHPYTYRVLRSEDDRFGDLVQASSHTSAALKYAEEAFCRDSFNEIEVFVAQVTGLGDGTQVRFVVAVEAIPEFSIREKSEVVK